jgi:hypothetical protein
MTYDYYSQTGPQPQYSYAVNSSNQPQYVQPPVMLSQTMESLPPSYPSHYAHQPVDYGVHNHSRANQGAPTAEELPLNSYVAFPPLHGGPETLPSHMNEKYPDHDGSKVDVNCLAQSVGNNPGYFMDPYTAAALYQMPGYQQTMLDPMSAALNAQYMMLQQQQSQQQQQQYLNQSYCNLLYENLQNAFPKLPDQIVPTQTPMGLLPPPWMVSNMALPAAYSSVPPLANGRPGCGPAPALVEPNSYGANVSTITTVVVPSSEPSRESLCSSQQQAVECVSAFDTSNEDADKSDSD